MFLLSNASLRFSYPTLGGRHTDWKLLLSTGRVWQAQFLRGASLRSTAPLFPILSTGLHSRYRTWTRIRLNQVSVVLGARVPEPPSILGYKTVRASTWAPESRKCTLV